MECKVQNTNGEIGILSQKNTAEYSHSDLDMCALHPEVQPYIVELFSKIIPDKKTVEKVLTRISQ